MTTPLARNPGITALLDALAHTDTRAKIMADCCVRCWQEAKTFRDELSRREYAISGLCQPCQDRLFADLDE